jgi:glycosyltransferase involved in cell wall biosynthesis
MIPHNKMVEYYSKIDVLVCSSKCEGTPNPVLEAMACGVPVISTKVGIVPEALGKLQKEYILEERTKECMKEKIIKLLNNCDNISKLSSENLKQIKNWEWKKVCKKMEKFFDEAFKTSK